MGDSVLRERDPAIDLESGGTTSEEDGPKDAGLGITQAKKLLGRVWNGSVNLDGSVKGEGALNSRSNSEFNAASVPAESVPLLSDKKLGGEEKVAKDAKRDTPRKKSSKKPPKPPRPPKPLLLDAADQKLVKEITELAMLKKARIERVKALKRMKAAKAASSTSNGSNSNLWALISNSNLWALIITVLFCLIVILQGAFSRGHSNANFQGSPESAGETTGGLISVQYYRDALASSTHGPASGSESPNVVERFPRWVSMKKGDELQSN